MTGYKRETHRKFKSYSSKGQTRPQILQNWCPFVSGRKSESFCIEILAMAALRAAPAPLHTTATDAPAIVDLATSSRARSAGNAGSARPWGAQVSVMPSVSATRRVDVVARVAQRTEPELYEGIAGFYDESSGVWEDIWGEHMHHGYYDDEDVAANADGSSLVAPNHLRAQLKMIERSLMYAGVPGTR